ncbi:MAG: HD domain-containing phosphohydrolase [Candidatus Scalinduaceae bacterium]
MDEGIRILVVDDEPKICQLIEELLRREGYQTDTSLSGVEALQMMKKHNYQMLLTDLKMPGIDGLELIRKAKKEYPEIRTIMVTGYATVETAVQSLRHGVDDYITKPFNIFELKKAVNRTLYGHQIAMENKQLLDDLKKTNIELDFYKQKLTLEVQTTGKHLTDANKELVQRINELDTINEISKAITSVLDTNELLNLCLGKINEKLKVKQSSIMLLDEEKKELIVKAYQGDRCNLVIGKTRKIGEGIAGRVAKERKPILVKNIIDDNRLRGSEKPDYVTKSFVSAPLISGKRLLGVINITDKISRESFSETDVNLLCIMAGQVSIALENMRLYKTIEENCFNTVRSLANLLEARDSFTNGHSQRVSEYALSIADMIGVSPKEKDILHHAAQLHDIGKIGISERILNKPDKLSKSEFDVIKSHPIIGEKIIEPLDFLKEASHYIRGHHESFDGSGYPDKLGGKDIPLLTKIMTVADAFDAMTSERTYRPSKKINEAISELNRVSGKQLDPVLVDAFASHEMTKISSELESYS